MDKIIKINFMIKKESIETLLIIIIAFLFCLPLFVVYSVQQNKINNIESDVLEIKQEIYTLKLDMLTQAHNENQQGTK